MEDLLFKDIAAPVVTSATKVEQPIYESPSAITVITAEDIRRMGARRLVDVFRWTPGLDVFTLTGNASAVSARGVYSLHQRYINEMLVQIDGRSVYVDFLGGVDWDALPILLEEIDRIEIIRGPSGSLYGPNAFAGTISIYTKQKPEPSIARTSVGTNHYFEHNMVHWYVNDYCKIRLGVGWMENEGFGTGGGRDFLDDNNLLRMNMFSQFRLTDATDLQIRSGWLTGSRGFQQFGLDGTGREDTDVPYGQVTLEHRFHEDAKFRAQYFHNHFLFDRPFGNNTRGLRTWTDVILLEQYWRINDRHRLIYGGEFRNFVAHSQVTATNRIEENFRSLFVEDDITLLEKKLHLILGLRYDDFTVSGDDFSPRAALVWTPAPQHSMRFSIARAVATPMTVASHLDYTTQVGFVDLGVPLGIVPSFARVIGNLNLDPESIVAYEAGYRGRWTERLDVSADFFIYEIQDLVRLTSAGPAMFDPGLGGLLSPFVMRNFVDSLAYGTELSTLYRWNQCLTTSLGYSYKDLPDVRALWMFGGVTNFKHSIFASWDWRFAYRWMLSTRLAWYDQFAVTNTGSINDYLRFDLRLGRNVLNDRGFIEFIGQNLLDPRHPESNTGVEVNRNLIFSAGLRY